MAPKKPNQTYLRVPDAAGPGEVEPDGRGGADVERVGGELGLEKWNYCRFFCKLLEATCFLYTWSPSGSSESTRIDSMP